MKEERYTGCLLGLGVGDALGAPMEFMSSSQINIKHGIVKDMIGGGWLNLRPGETTDDTALALALAQSLVEVKTFDAEDAASRYLAWFQSGPKDVGNTIRASLSHIADGVPYQEASAQAHSEVGGKSAGNGTVMRCAPLALALADNESDLITHSRVEATITHHDPLAGLGSASLNVMISAALGPGKDKSVVLGKAREVLTGMGEGRAVPDPTGKEARDLRPTGYVLDTLECAVWAFLGGKSFEECLIRAVNLGGDSDTIGAVCGALCGAWYGASRIPERWLRPLDERDGLESAGKALFEGAHP